MLFNGVYIKQAPNVRGSSEFKPSTQHQVNGLH